MGLSDNLPEQSRIASEQSADAMLRQVSQDLKTLQQDLIAQLGQDVNRLQAEKAKLLNEIERLRNQREMLQSEQGSLLNQRQLAQQQVWAKQLAQVMAAHLHALLVQRLSQPQSVTAVPPGSNSSAGALPATNTENAYRVLASLDSTLTRTLDGLRQDLSSYQSSLTQQLSRMQTLEQQGEALLEALVNRLSQQLQREMARSTAPPPPPPPPPVESMSPPRPEPPAPHREPQRDTEPKQTASPRSAKVNRVVATVPPPASTPIILPTAPASAPEAPAVVKTALRVPGKGLSQFQAGLLLIILSTLTLSLHNVVVGIIGYSSQLFGTMPIGGYIRLNTMGNSMLILWMRMLVVVPLMSVLAQIIYPPVWTTIRSFFQSKDRALMGTVIGSGGFLFMSQVLIYIAIGQIGPGVAITILFMYPIITVPLAWLLFKDRPTNFRLVIMAAILVGVIFTAVPKFSTSAAAQANVPLGVSAAVISGVAFALYLISMQISFRKLHPVPVSLIQFSTIFVLTSLSLIFLNPLIQVEVLPENRLGFILGGIVLGTLTLVGYLLNNFGVRLMGAAMASVVASSGPVLTALLAFLIIPGDRTALEGIQILGILVVTLGVAALSFERILLQKKALKATK